MIPPNSIELLVLQPTAFCNIDCKYCYLPDRTKKRVMPLETLELILRNLAADEALAEGFELLWHAGEPLTAGLAFYEAANKIIEKIIPGAMGRQTFQTNGLLINDAWCRYFKKVNAIIGLSLDGPKHFHDANRRTRSGKGTYDSVIKSIDTLRRNNIDFYIICVLTSLSLREPDTIFAFLKEHGITRACFNIEETEGINVSETFSDVTAYNHARQFFDFAIDRILDPENRIWVREIWNTINFIKTSATGSLHSQLTNPFHIVTIDVDGNWSTFCPELMSFQSERFGNFKFGNLRQSPISKDVNLNHFRAVQKEIQQGVEICRKSCDYFSICGGGRPANKFGEHQRFDISETVDCKLSIKTLSDACVATLASLINDGSTGNVVPHDRDEVMRTEKFEQARPR